MPARRRRAAARTGPRPMALVVTGHLAAQPLAIGAVAEADVPAPPAGAVAVPGRVAAGPVVLEVNGVVALARAVSAMSPS